jgi:CheY-like chemotaxis protein
MPGGEIWLTAEKEANHAVVSVRDTGIGIAPEMLSTIFEMYSQIETPSLQNRSGLGIGLNVVKKLVEMHGGTIQAFSRGEGESSELVLRLPLAEEKSTAEENGHSVTDETSQAAMLEAAESSAVRPSVEKRILIIDDNADAVKMLEFLLSGDGYEVRTGFDGETGIETARAFKPHVYVLEIGMPKTDGYELARILRKMMPNVLLIALTGCGQPEDRERTNEAGFNHHLVKPVDFDTLKILVEQKYDHLE